MAIKPITGMLRRRLILDLSVGLGLGFVGANVWWYGFHLPRVALRDQYYERLEAERAQKRAEQIAALSSQ